MAVCSLVESPRSWSVGVSFGRFDVRLRNWGTAKTGGAETVRSLPACSSAMLAGDDGLPIERAAGYPIPLPHIGILVDDPVIPRD